MKSHGQKELKLWTAKDPTDHSLLINLIRALRLYVK